MKLRNKAIYDGLKIWNTQGYVGQKVYKTATLKASKHCWEKPKKA